MVDDDATALLMQYFYKSLIADNNVKTALKNAQQKLIKDGYSDPFYWAAFIVME